MFILIGSDLILYKIFILGKCVNIFGCFLSFWERFEKLWLYNYYVLFSINSVSIDIEFFSKLK